MNRKCKNCGVRILDPMNKCPLCHHTIDVVERGRLSRYEPAYPLARQKTNRGQRALQIYLVCAIAVAVILFCINVGMHDYYWWTVLVVILLVYGFVTMFFSVKKQIGHQPKMMLLSLLAVLVVLFIDFATGFAGWTLNYVYPGLMAFLDILIVLLMLINKRNWQSYIVMQIWVVVLSIAPFVLYLFGLVDHLWVSRIVLLSVILAFVATLLIGGSRARSEMIRRFHR